LHGGRDRTRGARLKKAMITGGAGFIGYHLARRLVDDGWRVDVVDNFARGAADQSLADLAASSRARVLERDLTDPEGLGGLDGDYTHVFHLAAIVGVSNVVSRPFEVLRDNTAMLEKAIEIARAQQRLERFLFASTSEVYARTIERDSGPLPTPEHVALTLPDLDQPRASYLLSKIYGEAMCRHSGIPFTIVRPHNVFGPRMGLAHVVPELLARAHAAPDGGTLEVFSVDHQRTFCYVDDAVSMLVRAAETHACEGETLNVGSEGPEVAIGELARIVIATVGKSLEVVPMPDTPGSPRRRCPDMSKLTRLTGCRAGIDLATGVRRTYEWYQASVFDQKPVAAR
jgi:nucleoside-diphosphate-sugar epimerase